MFTLFDHDQRGRRRDFLRFGAAAGLAGLTSRIVTAGGGDGTPLLTGKSVIFLFLHGGPTQFETFDPKPDAPAEIRSATGHIATKIPGVYFGSTFTRLAALADQLTIVRSFRPGDGDHNIKPVVGRNTNGANLGSYFARVAGPNDPKSGLPTNAVLFPRAVDPQCEEVTTGFGRFDATGNLGSGFAPFVPGAGGNLQRDMQLALPLNRLDDRRSLLTGLDRWRTSLDNPTRVAGLDQLRHQAMGALLGGAAKALDLKHEDPKTIERYDTAPMIQPERISRKWNNRPQYIDNAKSMGKLLLLARRLCEHGAGFVTVTSNFVWDNHADVNNCGPEEAMQYMGQQLDYAVSAFLEDVHARGLDKRIMLVCCGEMGRTPRLNDRGGRDHWGGLGPLLLAGGGYEMGRVVGQSDAQGAEPRSEPVTIPHLTSTILRTLMDPGQVRVRGGIPSEIIDAANAAPIPGFA